MSSNIKITDKIGAGAAIITALSILAGAFSYIGQVISDPELKIEIPELIGFRCNLPNSRQQKCFDNGANGKIGSGSLTITAAFALTVDGPTQKPAAVTRVSADIRLGDAKEVRT